MWPHHGQEKGKAVCHFILTSVEFILLALQLIKNVYNFYFIYAVLFLLF